MIELENEIRGITRFIRLSTANYRRGREKYGAAETSYKKATELRYMLLQQALDEKGLAVCAIKHHQVEKISKPTAEQLGIYPRDKMRIVFYEDGPSTRQGEYDDYIEHTLEVELLCPEHFPKDEKWYAERPHGDYGFKLIRSEVVIENDRLILTVDGSDVTKSIQKRSRSQLNGRYNFMIENEIFRFFGIPDLPDKPNYDAVHRGW